MTYPSYAFEPKDWMDRALCRNFDPDLWFPNVGHDAREAKAVCQHCPVRLECLQFAMDGADTWAGLSYGVWGGTNATERYGNRRGKRKG